ncbi:hypothetical protein PG999_011494 [Apiospora kogelbergensis]|uniref:Rhodopsin domain-containing protein n=1 Tax=Apiospora kogelbergensis TaxID=1337665 RepID=A0AAW0QEN4_9PEZI
MSILPERLPHTLDGPAQASPDGVHRFDPAPNRNACGLAAASVCLAIATVMITLLGAFVSVVLLSQSPGLWVHLWDVRVRDLEPFIKKQFVFDTCYGLTMIFAKAAVLVEWVHIFAPSGRGLFFWACHTVSFMNGLLYVAAVIATWLSCIPQLKIWRPWEAGHCIDGKRLGATVAVLNLVFNLVVLLLPQRAVKKRRIMRMHKLGFALLFSVGTLACVFAAGRVHAAFTLRHDKDASYYSTVPNLLGLAEGTCVLTVFCLGLRARYLGGENT